MKLCTLQLVRNPLVMTILKHREDPYELTLRVNLPEGGTQLVTYKTDGDHQLVTYELVPLGEDV